MATRSTGKYLGGRLEERAVEIQALARCARKAADLLLLHERSEGERHLALAHADGRAAEILVGQLIAGDSWESGQLERLRDIANAIASEGHDLAGDLRRFLAIRAEREFFSVERAS